MRDKAKETRCKNTRNAGAKNRYKTKNDNKLLNHSVNFLLGMSVLAGVGGMDNN